MIKTIGLLSLVIMLVTGLSGCTVSTKDSIIISKPITQISDKVLNEDGEVFIADNLVAPKSIVIIPFDNESDEEAAPLILRQVINSQLSGKNFQLLHPSEIDRRLPDGMRDPVALATYFGVDGVLMGSVTEFERLFAGIYARTKLGVSLTLYDKAGTKIWAAKKTITESAGGASTTVWGALLAVATAAMHLDDVNLYAAADKLGRQIATIFPQPANYRAVTGPNIDNVIHNQANATLKYGDTIEVGIKGEPNQLATIQLTGLHRQDLDEVEPGIYVGKVMVEPDWQQNDVGVRGILQNKEGVNSILLSAMGLISFDNTPPPAVTELSGSLSKGNLKLAWLGNHEAKYYRIFALNDDSRELLATTQQNTTNLPITADLFAEYRIEVVAVDAAGNQSASNDLLLTNYPSELVNAQVLRNEITGIYDQSVVLTKQFSPYQVTAPVTINEQAKLYIEPGVVLQFTVDATIGILGELHIWGESSPVMVESVDQIPRQLPYFTLSSQKTVNVTGLTMSQAGVGIEANTGSPQLDMLQITGSRFSAMILKGDVNMRVRDCLIDGSNTSGIVVSDYAKLTINSCTIRNNSPFHIQNASSYEIDASDNQWAPDADMTTILGKVKVK